MAEQRSVLLFGEPGAGKSNYLFRLWLAIRSERHALKRDGLPSDLEYLNLGAAELLQGRFARHTPSGRFYKVEVPVRAEVRGEKFGGRLVVPDCSGEECVKVFREREWTKDWEEEISSRCACLIFVREAVSVAPLDWVGCQDLLAEAQRGGPVAVVEEVGDASAAEQAAKGRDYPIPTQTLLVEWLQFLREAFTAVVGRTYQPRIGIIVSAWDAIPPDYTVEGPRGFLRLHYKLLDQFVEANPRDFELQTFGVSVVGGDLEDAAFRDACLSTNPDRAGYVVHTLRGQPERSEDITLPVAWALNLPTGT